MRRVGRLIQTFLFARVPRRDILASALLRPPVCIACKHLAASMDHPRLIGRQRLRGYAKVGRNRGAHYALPACRYLQMLHMVFEWHAAPLIGRLQPSVSV